MRAAPTTISRTALACCSEFSSLYARIREMAPTCPEADDMLYIRFRGAELTLPGRTDMDTVAALLKSIQRND